MGKALSVLQSASSKNENAIVVDADEAFGQSIGLQLKNITNDQSKAYSKMKIYEVLFQAQFGVSGATQPQNSQQQRQLSTSPIYQMSPPVITMQQRPQFASHSITSEHDGYFWNLIED